VAWRETRQPGWLAVSGGEAISHRRKLASWRRNGGGQSGGSLGLAAKRRGEMPCISRLAGWRGYPAKWPGAARWRTSARQHGGKHKRSNQAQAAKAGEARRSSAYLSEMARCMAAAQQHQLRQARRISISGSGVKAWLRLGVAAARRIVAVGLSEIGIRISAS